ncbi:ArdC-like ssDNA-binding domain-containing protein [Cryobacterium sp. SO2]|uniref:ArdC-like ssDNA-binding domain-containing protein n=1 Tax=Cryobacterium sp. SO2 TaxID=1897060 RepID=UPI00223E4164|nr:ArdC-like ssDNA-binding domain-containing protein [Cryobacterium sp. SO2]WEO76072.1 ArdC-like ssDNA-binding domain-containing protein [Cryobacterium sp. SO2]
MLNGDGSPNALVGEAHLCVSHTSSAWQPLGKVINVSTEPQTRQDRDAKLASLHERLVASVEELVNGNEWRRALEFSARFRSRSFNNSLLIWGQHSAAHERGTVPTELPSYVAGFRHWQALGRHVIAGQKGYMIFAPLTARFASSSPVDMSSWRRLNRHERPRSGEVVRQRMVGARPAYVWDVSQTEGSSIPERPAPMLLRGEAPQGLWDDLRALIEESGFAVLLVPDAGSLHGANGQTDFGGRRVFVRADIDAAARVKTLGHELAHVRLHDPDAGTLSHRGMQEVEAESVALMIGAAHGMDTSDYTIPYVSAWASSVPDKTETEVIQETGERVRRAAVAILDGLSTHQIGAGDPPELGPSQPVRHSDVTLPDPLDHQSERPGIRTL